MFSCFNCGGTGEAQAAQGSYVIDSTEFSGGLATGARMIIFNAGTEVRNATDGGTGQDEVALYIVT